MKRMWFGVLLFCLPMVISGCAVTTQITNTQRSSIEQRLLVRSLQRALSGLDTEVFEGKTVFVDLYGLTPDKEFAREFCTAWLQARQVHSVADPQKADLRVKFIASVLGVDQGQSFFGLPALTVPIVGFTTPEIALFKSVSHRGEAELQVYVLDGHTGKFISKTPVESGEASYDQYTILIVVNFSHTDLDQPERSDFLAAKR